MFALVPLDSLDLNLGSSFALGIAGFRQRGLSFFLSSVFLGTLSSRHGQGRQVGIQGLCGIKFGSMGAIREGGGGGGDLAGEAKSTGCSTLTFRI